MVTLPFPEPGRLVESAYRALDKAENGTAEEKHAHKVLGPPERPWDPPSCAPALRGQVWEWLDAVAGWVNHEYTWGVDRLIPACWPAHPHIAHELAVLADLRRTAGRENNSGLLEYWHRDSLPMFLERMHLRLAGSCAAAHQEWTAAARYRAFHNDANQRQREAWFAHDLDIVPPGAYPRQVAVGDALGVVGLPRFFVVNRDTGEVTNPDPANGGGDRG